MLWLGSRISQKPQCGFGQDRRANRQGALVQVKPRMMEKALIAFDQRAQREHCSRGHLGE